MKSYAHRFLKKKLNIYNYQLDEEKPESELVKEDDDELKSDELDDQLEVVAPKAC